MVIMPRVITDGMAWDAHVAQACRCAMPCSAIGWMTVRGDAMHMVHASCHVLQYDSEECSRDRCTG